MIWCPVNGQKETGDDRNVRNDHMTVCFSVGMSYCVLDVTWPTVSCPVVQALI